MNNLSGIATYAIVEQADYFNLSPKELGELCLPLLPSQRDSLLALHATLQDALTWLDETPDFADYRRKVIACLRSTEKVLGLEQSRAERKR